MNFKNAGSSKFVLYSQNPAIQKMVIDTLRNSGVKVYRETTEFDNDYPFLQWDGQHLTQAREKLGANVLSLEDFLYKFVVNNKTLQVGDYQATFTKDEVEVGCQTIPYGIVKGLYDRMTELRK
jgi:hypothetical protein